MLRKPNFLFELQSLDKELYKNLKFLKNYEGDVGDLGLNFSITDSNKNEIELISNGKNVAVDN